MNGMRNLFRALTAILILAFAVPGMAATPEKKFSVVISPNLISSGSVSLSAKIKNETPNGNSSINSWILRLPAGYTLDTATLPTANWAGQIAYTSTSVSMSNMSPLKPLQSFVLTLKVNAPAGSTLSACTPSVWTAQAWTGSNFSGDTFRQLFPPELNVDSTTVVGTPQQLSFTTQPPSQVVKGETIPVGVLVSTTCGPVKAANVVINVAGCTAGCLTGTTTATTNANGIASFTDLKILVPGTYELTATSTGYPPVSATIKVFDGTLNCEPNPPYAFESLPPGVTNSSQSGYAAGQRGRFNKDGSQCNPVDYVFTNNILTQNPITLRDNNVHLEWDTVVDPYATFMYSMTWKTEDVDTASPNAGWPVFKRAYVAWQTLSDGITPKFVPAIACLSSELPAPYATINVAVPDATTTTLQIAVPSPLTQFWHALPATVPFPIVVGIERMNVTAMSVVSSGSPAIYNLTVVRHDGVPASRAAPHAAGALVMSTPLPIDSDTASDNYQQQANMCVANHGWMAAGIHPVTGVAQIRYFTTVIDIGDGWVRVGQ